MKKCYILSFLIVLFTGCSPPSINNKQIASVGGHNIEYATAGNASPVIVFINGGGPADMDSWGKVYPEITKISSVFAYNRLGSGNSDKTDVPQTGERIVETLQKLLHKIDRHPPYILVGHSLGGLYANLFTRTYPDNVAGVVLVDSSHPDQSKMMQDASKGFINGTIQKLYAATNPTKFSEITAFDETAFQVKKSGPFPNIPLIVISSGNHLSIGATDETERMVETHQQSLVTLSSKGKRIIAKESGHFIQNDEPDIVSNAILEIINTIRN